MVDDNVSFTLDAFVVHPGASGGVVAFASANAVYVDAFCVEDLRVPPALLQDAAEVTAVDQSALHSYLSMRARFPDGLPSLRRWSTCRIVEIVPHLCLLEVDRRVHALVDLLCNLYFFFMEGDMESHAFIQYSFDIGQDFDT